MSDFDVIEYLKTHSWSSEVQDAMIKFIEQAIQGESVCECDMVKYLLEEIGGPER